MARTTVRLAAIRTSLLDHLVLWVLAAVAVGLLVPGFAWFEWLILPALFVMVGSISLTQDPESLVGAPWASAAALAAIGAALPIAAWAGGRLLGAPEGLLLGLVIFFAAPPELTTPVLTRIARGDVALSLATLLLASLVAVAVVPVAASVLGGHAAVAPLVRSLLAAVIIPMALAVGVRTMARERVRPHDETLAAISAAMLVVVMLLVAGQSRGALLDRPALAPLALAVGGPILFLAGLVGRGLAGIGGAAEGRSGAFSLGIRDFAVAAALIVAAELPREGAVAALALGMMEMLAGSWLAGHWRRRAAATDL